MGKTNKGATSKGIKRVITQYRQAGPPLPPSTQRENKDSERDPLSLCWLREERKVGANSNGKEMRLGIFQ
jgi:hypothetical protein